MKRLVLVISLAGLFLVIASRGYAADIEAKLDENAGVSEFVVQDSDGTQVVGVSSDGDVTLTDTAATVDPWIGLGASAGKIEFDDQTTDEVNILNANVGIGTTGPVELLQLRKDVAAGVGPVMLLQNSQYASAEGSEAQIKFSLSNPSLRYANIRMIGKGIYGSPDRLTLGITRYSDDVYNEVLVIKETGNVGIGTTSPGTKLDVATVDAIGYSALFGGSSERIAIFSVTGLGGIGMYTTGDDLRLFVDNDASRGIAIKATSGNVGIGTTSPGGGTTAGTAVLSIANGTAPVGGVANQASLYTSGGELYTLDSAGNATLQSPHDPVTGEWIFYSKNTRTGRVVRVDMEHMVKVIERVTGEKFMAESYEAVN